MNPGAFQAGDVAVFVSPHLDDVGFSCPALISQLAQQGLSVHVLTVFSHAWDGFGSQRPLPGRPDVVTRPARGDAGVWDRLAAHYDERRREDSVAARRLGFNPVFLGFADAPYRGPEHRDLVGLTWEDGRTDDAIVASVARAVSDELTRLSPQAVFFPLAVGWHIDHRLTFAASRTVERSAADGWFYEDRPYALIAGAVQARMAELGHTAAVDADALVDAFVGATHVRRFLRGRDAVARTEREIRDRVRRLPAAEPRGWRSAVVESESARSAWESVSAYGSQWPAFWESREEFEERARAAASAMGSKQPWAERYWTPGGLA